MAPIPAGQPVIAGMRAPNPVAVYFSSARKTASLRRSGGK
ncbi:hypothetical protein L525_4415 [Bordetella bronchiseptica MBORD782]|nr:hypothetical protein L525_4415 [Bordetella bronchiseptica MBORD782]